MPIFNSGSGFYVGRLFDVQLSAQLRHRGLEIYKRNFDGSDAGIVSFTSNSIVIPDHYFVTGEKLSYFYDDFLTTNRNAVGIASTSIENVGISSKLPQTVYAVKLNDRQISLAPTRKDALARVPKVFTFTQTGAGLTHYFVGESQNTRALLTIDNVIQSPVIETIVSTRLKTFLSGASDLAEFVGITSFFVGDLIKIDNEIMTINYVGLGDENTVLLRRPTLGTQLADHVAGSRVVKLSGNYNIVNSTVYFPVAPFGKLPISNPNDPDPEERDYVGLETYSTFDGRVFLRSGFTDTTIGPYATNYLFDDISPAFLGISTQAIITSGSKNVSGFSTNQGVVLINNILQTPDFIDFGLGESSGITTISFTGSKLTNLSDINTSTIPRGGIIVQVGTNDAFGYQPRVSAGGTVAISSIGNIQTISIGNSGSGYRASEEYILQTKVSQNVSYPSAIIPLDNVNGLFDKLNLLFTGNNISIVVKDTIQDQNINNSLVESNIVSIGNSFITLSSPVAAKWKNTANILKGSISYLRVKNVPTGIVDAYVIKENNSNSINYEHIGFSTIFDGHIQPTIVTNVGFGFTNFKVDQINRVRTVALDSQNEINLSDPVSISTTRNVVSVAGKFNDAKLIGYDEENRTLILKNNLPVNVGIGETILIKFYDPLKIKYDDPLSYDDLFLEYSKDSSVGVGSYAKGNLSISQGFRVLDFELTNNGYSYGNGEILTVPTGGVTGIPTITKFEVDRVISDVGIFTGTSQIDSGFGESIAVSSNGSIIVVGSPNDNFIGVNAGAAYIFSRKNKKLTPTDVTYDPANGRAVFTVPDHGLSFGQQIAIEDESITFTCSMDNNRTEHKLPESDQYFSGRNLPIADITKDTFTLFVGASGPNEFFTPSDAKYNPSTGSLELTIGFHGLSVGEGIIILDNSLSFTCDMDNNQLIKTYPRPGIDPFAQRSIKIAQTTPTTITVNVGSAGTNKYFTPSAADYDSVTGILTVFVGQHGLGVGRNIVFKNESLYFSCDQDGFASSTAYPRSGSDPFSDKNSVEIIDVGFTSTTATNAVYNASVGIVTLTVPSHGFSSGDYILIVDNSLSFTCDLDGNSEVKSYPRPGYDYPSNRWIPISNVTINTFQINIGPSPDASPHTFAGSFTNGILRQTGTFTVNVGSAGAASGSVHQFVSSIPNAIEYLPQSNHTFVGAQEFAVQHLPQSTHSFVRAKQNALTALDYVSQVGIITGSQAFHSGDEFGYSVSIGQTGSPILIGAPGNIDSPGSGTNSGLCYVFDLINNDTSWIERGVIRPLNISSIPTGGGFDRFGESVSMSDNGQLILIGSRNGESPDVSPSIPGSGAVFHYERFTSFGTPVFVITDYFNGPTPNSVDRFGSQIKLSRDGRYLLVQSPETQPSGNQADAGVVYVYKKSDTLLTGIDPGQPRYWILQQELSEFNQFNGQFGNSLAISDDYKTIAIGMKRKNLYSQTATGTVAIFDKNINSDKWEITEYLSGSKSTNSDDNFGASLALSANGQILVVGAPNDESDLPNQSGLVYVYDRRTKNRVGNDFVEVGVVTAFYANNFEDNYGYSVSVTKDGSFFVSGSPNDEIQSSSGISTYGVAYGSNIVIKNRFEPLKITIDETFTDSFSGWTFGSLQVLDSPDVAFDGSRTEFPLKIGGKQISIEARPGSQLELQYNLIVQINDIYQVPNESYIFNGGSTIEFLEAPNQGDKCVIIFYRGTSGVDTKFIDILETIKEGDIVTINDDFGYQQDPRTVSDILTTDIIETNVYTGAGIDESQQRLRPIKWCKQLVDKVISGKVVGKSRKPYEPEIYPKTKIIKTLSNTDGTIWVQNVRTFFDSNNEYPDLGLQKLPQKDIVVISNDPQEQASVSVSIAGSSINLITIENPGFGYVTPPDISISYPTLTGFTTTGLPYHVRAEAVASIDANGSISGITITNSGIGYTSATAFVSPPSAKYEVINEVIYEGDFGWITGISTKTSNVSPCNLVLDLFIPLDSYLRDSEIVSSPNPNPVSGLSTNYYFSITDSTLGSGVTISNPLVSLDTSGNPLFYGDNYFDGIYQVNEILTFDSVVAGIAFTSSVGIAFTNLRRVVVPVQNYAGLESEIAGLAKTSGVYLGKFSWGRLIEIKRGLGKTFNLYNTGISGISTSADVIRLNPLKPDNYTV